MNDVKNYPENYDEYLTELLNEIDIKYEDLADSQKENLKKIALKLGYRLDVNLKR